MRQNLDIYFGLAACLVGIATAVASFLPLGGNWIHWELWGGPGLWALCVVAMYSVSKRKLKTLWWVWLSFPLAFLWMVTLFYAALPLP
ncbi:hypothetical protein [Desulfoferula mesophila]|uniref:Uncharacterized protein n=1 Tax=Desulfoferula mesophila TaxID=3058419 RepID=A0AAU9ENP0_9BACT|nr:hypothetical protein FAK_32100 [Desulfoferula mesophilus]